MSFLREIAEKAGERARGGYAVFNFNGECVYLEGVERLVTLSGEKIEFSAFGKLICVEGENLEIAEMERGCAMISGRISGEYVAAIERK